PIQGKPVKAKVKTQDLSVSGTIKILGNNFKDVTSVKVGAVETKIESLSPDYTYMIVTVPKGADNLASKPLPVSIVTKAGN
ncbi:IPT/TIG domain-containing protein, partial [Streptococcus pyogenes]